MAIPAENTFIINEQTENHTHDTTCDALCNAVAVETALVARQPILDRNQNVFCYQLLFHGHCDSEPSHETCNTATIQMIQNSLNVIGLDELARKKMVMVSLTRELLNQGIQDVLPTDRTIVLLENEQGADEEIVSLCELLKDTGYTLAFGRWVLRDNCRKLLDLTDIVVVDCVDSVASRVELDVPDKIKLLAAQLETQAKFRDALEAGYDYFQGSFLCKPEVVRGREIPALKANQLRFIAEVQKPDLKFDMLEAIIKRDVSLLYKLLRYLNSASFSFRSKVESIKHALVLLGERPLKQWATLIAITEMCDGKPNELSRSCLIRARFCESIADDVDLGDHKYGLFLVGLLSAIDAMVDQPLDKLLNQMPISNDIKDALLIGETPMGRVFRLFLAYEAGEFTTTGQMAYELGIDIQQVAKVYCDAIAWADNVMKG